MSPSHIVVPLGGFVLAGCHIDDDARIREIVRHGFTPTEVPPGFDLEDFVWFTRSTVSEENANG